MSGLQGTSVTTCAHILPILTLEWAPAPEAHLIPTMLPPSPPPIKLNDPPLIPDIFYTGPGLMPLNLTLSVGCSNTPSASTAVILSEARGLVMTLSLRHSLQPLPQCQQQPPKVGQITTTSVIMPYPSYLVYILCTLSEDIVKRENFPQSLLLTKWLRLV